MKKALLTLLIAVAYLAANAQTNTFPASGNAGIGTLSPQYPLDVVGTGNFSGNILTTTSGALFGTTAPTATSADLTNFYYFGLMRSGNSSRFNGLKIYNVTNAQNFPASRLGFYTDNTGYNVSTEFMTINELGNVGIGNTSPSSKLTVNGTILGSNIYNVGNNSFFGLSSGNSTATGTQNTFIGYANGHGVTTGSNNTILGVNLANQLTSGSGNILIGGINTGNSRTTAQSLTTGIFNIFIGQGAGASVTTTGNNIGIGGNALLGSTGTNNTAIGVNSGFSSSGSTGNNNTYYGAVSGYSNTTGSNNVYLGYQAGYINTTGSNLTFIGYNAGNVGTTDGLTNATAIGNNAQVTASNSLILGNGANVGIGTTAPTSQLHIVGSGSSYAMVNIQNTLNTGYCNINYTGTGETFQTGVANAAETTFGIPNSWYIYDGTNKSMRMVIKPNGNVLIGEATEVSNAYLLDINGSARAKAITVNVTGADFVFEPNYKLLPLTELKSYLQINHHLPEVTSAKEMQANGLNLGDNQIRLLQKVEELTLYLIKKDDETKEQQSQIDLLKEQLKAQQLQLDQLKVIISQKK